MRAHLLVAALLVVSACSSTDNAVAPSSPPTSAPSSVPACAACPGGSLPAGTLLYEGDGFELLVPIDWPVVPATEVEFGTGVRLDSAYLEEVAANWAPGIDDFVVFTPADNAGIAVFREAPSPMVTNAYAADMREFLLRSDHTDITSEVRTVPAGEAIIFRYRYEGLDGLFVYLRTEHSGWHFDPWPDGNNAILEGPLMAMIESLTDVSRRAPPTTVPSAPTTQRPTTTVETTSTTVLELPVTVEALSQYSGEGFTVLLPASWVVATRDTWEEAAGSLPVPDQDGFATYASELFANGGEALAVDITTGDMVSISRRPVILLSAEGYEYEVGAELEAAGGEFTTEIHRLPTGPAGSGIKAVVTWEPIGDDAMSLTATILDPSRSWVIRMQSSDSEPFRALFDAILDSFVDTIP